jgi:hypothetical protein
MDLSYKLQPSILHCLVRRTLSKINFLKKIVVLKIGYLPRNGLILGADL